MGIHKENIQRKMMVVAQNTPNQYPVHRPHRGRIAEPRCTGLAKATWPLATADRRRIHERFHVRKTLPLHPKCCIHNIKFLDMFHMACQLNTTSLIHITSEFIKSFDHFINMLSQRRLWYPFASHSHFTFFFFGFCSDAFEVSHRNNKVKLPRYFTSATPPQNLGTRNFRTSR